MKEIKK